TTVESAPRLSATAKRKQPSRAITPTEPTNVQRTEAEQLKVVLKRSRQETHISQQSGFSTDEGTGESDEEETRQEEEESFDPIPRTPEESEEESNDEEEQDLRLSEEERIQEEEDADELYRDININQGRGVQVTQNVKDSHVTLTPVNPDGPQESSSISSFVSSMLNPISDRRIIAVTELKIVEWYDYKHLDWILVRRDDDKIYKFKEGDLKRLRLQDIEDMSIVMKRLVEDLQLGVESYQKRLNLTKPDTYYSDLKRRKAYTTHSNPRGFIYQNKDNKNRLMRIDELHKFSDGTLNDVRNALDDHLKGIRMQYFTNIIWRRGDKDRATAMIQAIDKMLKMRRIMRSLEKFVGGRL
nr:hypothetical protein [Tanacetum cinerariifolium]